MENELRGRKKDYKIAIVFKDQIYIFKISNLPLDVFLFAFSLRFYRRYAVFKCIYN